VLSVARLDDLKAVTDEQLDVTSACRCVILDHEH
jgi:hypothetical protein